ncbi:putative ovule protein [Raphanus sativus]|nr:putative ovule protein [Raphanus sativus]
MMWKAFITRVSLSHWSFMSESSRWNLDILSSYPCLNQGSRVISSIVILDCGFVSRRRVRRRRRSGEVHLGMRNSPLYIFLYMTIRLWSLNGRYPALSTNSITPHDHTSILAPSYPFFARTSGAT